MSQDNYASTAFENISEEQEVLLAYNVASETKKNAFFRNNKLAITIVLISILSGIGYQFRQAVFKPSEPASGTEIYVLSYEMIANLHESEVLACFGVVSETISYLEQDVKQLEAEIACGENTLKNGNSETVSVKTKSGNKVHCFTGVNPTSNQENRRLFGQNHMLELLQSNRKFLKGSKQTMNSYEYQQKQIHGAMEIKEMHLAHTKEKIIQLRSGMNDCKGHTQKMINDEFMCAHVILNQLPQTFQCYDRNDTRHVNPAIRTVLDDFEKVDQPEHEKLKVFIDCVNLLDYKVSTRPDIEYVDLQKEREKKIADIGRYSPDKCRRPI